jgi:hypothetical protein
MRRRAAAPATGHRSPEQPDSPGSSGSMNRPGWSAPVRRSGRGVARWPDPSRPSRPVIQPGARVPARAMAMAMAMAMAPWDSPARRRRQAQELEQERRPAAPIVTPRSCGRRERSSGPVMSRWLPVRAWPGPTGRPPVCSEAGQGRARPTVPSAPRSPATTRWASSQQARASAHSRQASRGRAQPGAPPVHRSGRRCPVHSAPAPALPEVVVDPSAPTTSAQVERARQAPAPPSAGVPARTSPRPAAPAPEPRAASPSHRPVTPWSPRLHDRSRHPRHRPADRTRCSAGARSPAAARGPPAARVARIGWRDQGARVRVAPAGAPRPAAAPARTAHRPRPRAPWRR